MADTKSGSPMGSGNPPGQYSDGYLNAPKDEAVSTFLSAASYRGDMHIGIDESATVVGNQPKDKSNATLESRANKEDSIPQNA